MRDELINKIIMMLQSEDDIKNIQMELTIILNDYEISARETAIAIRNEDKNKYYLQKFIIAKTVSGRAERTLKFYADTLKNVLQKINKPADEITTDDIRYYLALRQKRDGISKVTANNELRSLRTFYSFLSAEDLVLKNPCLRIEQIKADKVQKKALNEMEVEKVRNACTSTLEKAIVDVFLSTGCRLKELSLMKISDIENDKLVVHGKGGKDRVVYLDAKAMLSIQLYLKDRKDTNPYLFPGGFSLYEKPSTKGGRTKKQLKEWYKDPKLVHPNKEIDMGTIEQKVRDLGKRAGVEKVHPHKFRRTCATLALRRGMPIEQVSKMLGHEQLGTTQIYLDLNEDELHQAHKKYVG